MPACRETVRRTRVAIAALALLMCAAGASAQTIVDPQRAEFDPSPDHDAVSSDGTAIVKSYSLVIYQSGTTKALQTINLGKPTPDADGKIRVGFVTLLKPAPTPGVLYVARVGANGPGGTAYSDYSNTFSFSSGCGTTITPSAQTFTAAGGTGKVAVQTGIGCQWTAVSSAPWLTITSGASGTESGNVAFSVAVNPDASTRTATITIAGQTFTVTQSGAGCTYSLSPTSQALSAAGGTGSFGVTTSAGCSWTASSGVSWITITGTASASGSGTVTFSVAVNPLSSSRSGTISVGGQTFTVNQAGSTSCTYSVNPTSQSVPAAGGTDSFTMTTGATCAWGTFSTAPWLTVVGPTSGAGNATITFSVAVNTDTTSRAATIMAGGQVVSVTQAGASTSCLYAIVPASVTVGAGGGTGSFSMTAGAKCDWTASSSVPWITLTGATKGSGSGTVAFSVLGNTGTTGRSGKITAGGQTFTVFQSGGSTACIYNLTPTSQSVGSLGGSNFVTVDATAGCSWTATSNKAWITIVAGASGTGPGMVNYSVASNTGGARSGALTIAGQTVTVSQAAAACSYSVTPTTVSAPATGTTGTITVTTTSTCSWSSFSSTPWITVTGSKTGSGSASYTVLPNSTGLARSGTILVAGITVQFTQGQ